MIRTTRKLPRTKTELRTSVSATPCGHTRVVLARLRPPYGVAASVSPLVAVPGNLPDADAAHRLVLDSSRAISTCLKPADDPSLGGIVLRIWEVEGESGPLDLRVRGFRRAIQTDLLERNLRDLQIVNGKIQVNLRGYGYAAVRLLD